MAMPWKRAKAKAAAIRADSTGQMLFDLNRLFNACFRIQAEASLAAGRHIPMVVENVRGAQPWVGRARWNFGSFYLWGDVPALMPGPQSASVREGFKTQGMNWSDRTLRGQDFTRIAGKQAEGIKQRGSGAAWWDKAPDERRKEATAIKNGNDWFGAGEDCSLQRRHGSKSSGRKAASAMIAKIPLPLSRHIAAVFRQAETARSLAGDCAA